MSGQKGPPNRYLGLLCALCEREGFSSSQTAEKTFAYVFDLANLHKDFDRMERSLSYWWSYVQDIEGTETARGLEMNKFLLTYTEYNTAVWTHVYRERVFQLTNAVLALGVPEDKPGNIKLVIRRLREGDHLMLLRQLELLREDQDSEVGRALKRRGEFVHRTPEQAWPSLKSGAQLQHSLDIDEETGLHLDDEMALDDVEADNLERKRDELMGLLRDVTEELEAFQERFCGLLYAASFGGPAN